MRNTRKMKRKQDNKVKGEGNYRSPPQPLVLTFSELVASRTTYPERTPYLRQTLNVHTIRCKPCFSRSANTALRHGPAPSLHAQTNRNSVVSRTSSYPRDLSSDLGSGEGLAFVSPLQPDALCANALSSHRTPFFHYLGGPRAFESLCWPSN